MLSKTNRSLFVKRTGLCYLYCELSTRAYVYISIPFSLKPVRVSVDNDSSQGQGFYEDFQLVLTCLDLKHCVCNLKVFKLVNSIYLQYLPSCNK